MTYRTTFTCADDAHKYGLHGKYKEEGGNWEFELLSTRDEGDDWGLVHAGKDNLFYPEKFVEKVK